MATKTLVTTFDEVGEAERAVQKLQQDGFVDVGWVSRTRDGREIAHGNLVEQYQQGSSLERSTVGGVLGGLCGLLIGATALTLIGVAGPFAVAGPIVSTAAGIGVGAALGRLTDRVAHVPAERPRAQAHRYGARLGKGEAAVTVTVDTEEEEARALEILRGEASLHKHPFLWRVPALRDEGRTSRISLW